MVKKKNMVDRKMNGKTKNHTQSLAKVIKSKSSIKIPAVAQR
jgi:hypothetical protein